MSAGITTNDYTSFHPAGIGFLSACRLCLAEYHPFQKCYIRRRFDLTRIIPKRPKISRGVAAVHNRPYENARNLVQEEGPELLSTNESQLHGIKVALMNLTSVLLLMSFDYTTGSHLIVLHLSRYLCTQTVLVRQRSLTMWTYWIGVCCYILESKSYAYRYSPG